MFHDRGIALPVGQMDIADPDGCFIGRADFYWERYGVIGEFDGRQKYGKLLMPGQDPGDVVFAEKRREDVLRAAGFGVGPGTNSARRDRLTCYAERSR